MGQLQMSQSMINTFPVRDSPEHNNNADDPCSVANAGSVEEAEPTEDGSPGIGAEFESPDFQFVKCPISQQDPTTIPNLKGQIVGSHSGDDWKLTVDTTSDPNKLQAEIIVDGTRVKVGTGAAAAAGDAVESYLTRVELDNGLEFDFLGSKFETRGSLKEGRHKLLWCPQITTSMPLEAVYSLMMEQSSSQTETFNILDGINSKHPGNLIVVESDFFQSSTNGIDKNSVTSDVLGFCSIVMTYAKSATVLQPGESPKMYSTFMPRTEFNTLFQQVKSKMPGELFNLFNSLACYKVEGNGVVIDKRFATGTTKNPISNGEFAKLQYVSGDKTLNIKDWITGIGAGDPSPDLLTSFDKNIDGSIGGLGSKMEKMFRSRRLAPLFEFRDLQGFVGNGFQHFMSQVDQAIQDQHAKFADAL